MGKKWSESRPAEKMLSLYTLLLTSSQPVRLTELSRLLNCAKQSVTRLIDQLESSHFGKIVRHQLGRQVAYSLDRPRHRPCTSLDAEGLRQLALCRELLLHFLPDDMHRVMRDSLYQAAALLPDTESLPPGGIGGRLSKGHIDYDPFAATLDCLTQAMQTRNVCTVSYRAALHRQEKTWQYAPLRLLAYRESLFVQGYMVTDDGPVERLFDDTTLLALHRITACHATGRSSAALPDIPTPSGEGLASWKWKKNLSKSACALPRRPPPMPPNAAGAGTSVAKCMTTVPSRCISRRITKRSVFPGYWALVTGPRCWPLTGCARRSKKRSMPWPACIIHRANRQTRPKTAALLPRTEPCGCRSSPRYQACVHP